MVSHLDLVALRKQQMEVAGKHFVAVFGELLQVKPQLHPQYLDIQLQPSILYLIPHLTKMLLFP